MSIPIHDNAEDDKCDVLVFLPGSTMSESPPRSNRPPPRPFKQSFDPEEDAATRKHNRIKRVELQKKGILKRKRFEAPSVSLSAPQEHYQPWMSLENDNPPLVSALQNTVQNANPPLVSAPPLHHDDIPPASQPLPTSPSSSTSLDPSSSTSLDDAGNVSDGSMSISNMHCDED
jgi:hypothetical protein